MCCIYDIDAKEPKEPKEVQKSRERRFLAVSMESIGADFGAGFGAWCVVYVRGGGVGGEECTCRI